MSAEDTLNENRKRRRGLRRQAEVEPIETYDDEQDEDEEDTSRGLTEKKGRITPGRRTQEIEESKSEGNFITRPLRGVSEYFEGVRAEMQKVVWPTREDVQRLTWIVLVTMVISSIVLGAISLVFTELFALGISAPAIFAVLFVVVVGVFIYYRAPEQSKHP